MDDETQPIPPGDRDPQGPLKSGTEFGKFRILGTAGVGAQGCVYRAYDQSLRQQVALKVIHSAILADSQSQRRFIHEGQLLARVDHPNVCRVLEAGVEAGQPFLVMVLVEGRSLREVQRSPDEGPLELDDQLACCARLARGLQEVHRAGVLHRDVKPSNVLLPCLDKPVLIDFGIARDTEGQLTELSMTGQSLGTVGYVSPEQLGLRGLSGRPDQRSDIFSLGVLAYEWLCGQLPFAGETAREVERSLQNYTLIPPRQLRPELPVGVDRILRRALSYDPRDRFQSVEEMAVAIEKLLRGENPGVGRLGIAHRTKRWVERNRAVTAIASLIIFTLSTALGVAVRESFMAVQSEHKAELKAYHQAIEATQARIDAGDLRGARQVLRSVERDDFAVRALARSLDPSVRRFSLGEDSVTSASLGVYHHLIATSNAELRERVFDKSGSMVNDRHVVTLDIQPHTIFASRLSERWIAVGMRGIRAGRLDSGEVDIVASWDEDQRVLSAMSDDLSKLVYVNSRKVIPPPPGKVTACLVGSDVGRDSIQQLWSFSSAFVDSLCCSRDGAFAVMVTGVSGLSGEELALVDLSTGLRTWTRAVDVKLSAVGVDSDRKSILLAMPSQSMEGVSVRRFLARSGAEIGRYSFRTSQVPDLVFGDQDGVLVGLRDGVGVYLSSSLNQEVARFLLHEGTADLFRDGPQGLYVSRSMNEVAVWDLGRGGGALRLSAGGTWAFSLAFDVESRRLIAGTSAKRLLTWDLSVPGRALVEDTLAPTTWIALNGRELKYRGGPWGSTVNLGNTALEERLVERRQVLAADRKLSRIVCLQQSNQKLVIVEEGRVVDYRGDLNASLGDKSSASTLRRIHLASSPDGDVFVVAGELWKVPSTGPAYLALVGDAVRRQLSGKLLFDHPVTALEFPFHDRIVVGLRNGEVQVFRFPSLVRVAKVHASTSSITKLASLPDRMLIAVADRKSVRLCHVELSHSLMILHRSRAPIYDLCYSANLDALAVGTGEGAVVWMPNLGAVDTSTRSSEEENLARSLVEYRVYSEHHANSSRVSAEGLGISTEVLKRVHRGLSGRERSSLSSRRLLLQMPLLPMPYYKWAMRTVGFAVDGGGPTDAAQSLRRGDYEFQFQSGEDFKTSRLLKEILASRAGRSAQLPEGLGQLVAPESSLLVELRALSSGPRERRVWLALENLVTTQNHDAITALATFEDEGDRRLARSFLQQTTLSPARLSEIVWRMAAPHRRTPAEYRAAYNLAVWQHDLAPSAESELALSLTLHRLGREKEARAHLEKALHGESLSQRSSRALMLAATIRRAHQAGSVMSGPAVVLKLRAHSPGYPEAPGLWGIYCLEGRR